MKTLTIVAFLVAFFGLSITASAQCRPGGYYSTQSPCYKTRTIVKYVNNPDTVARNAAANAQNTANTALQTATEAKDEAGKAYNYADSVNKDLQGYKVYQAGIDNTQNQNISAVQQNVNRQENSLWWVWMLSILGLLAGIVAILVHFANRQPQPVVYQQNPPQQQLPQNQAPVAQQPVVAGQNPLITQTFHGYGQVPNQQLGQQNGINLGNLPIEVNRNHNPLILDVTVAPRAS